MNKSHWLLFSECAIMKSHKGDDVVEKKMTNRKIAALETRRKLLATASDEGVYKPPTT